MIGQIETRIKTLGLELPKPAAAAANYIPFLIEGNQLFISGQLPMGPDGLQYKGKVGADLNIDQGAAAASLCALNILAQVKAALGGFEYVERCLKLGGFVNSTLEFEDHPAVINGASGLILSVFGDSGQHTRFAVGVANLPFGASVEIDALFSIR